MKVCGELLVVEEDAELVFGDDSTSSKVQKHFAAVQERETKTKPPEVKKLEVEVCF